MPYSVDAWANDDGTEARQLNMGIAPIMPSELLALMKSIAPVPNFASDVTGIKADMSQVFGCDDTYPIVKRLAHIHSAALGDGWQVMKAQAKPFFNALPHRYAGPHVLLKLGHSSLSSAIGSVSNKQIRGEYFSQAKENKAEIVGDLNVLDQGVVEVPNKPFIVLPDKDGKPTYVKAVSLKQKDGSIQQKTYGFTENGVGTVLVDKLGKHMPVWATHHIPNQGVLPSITWRKERDGSLQFVHEEPVELDVEAGGEQWNATKLSVIGCIVLASLNPNITNNWDRRQSLREGSPKTQIMGPLQATMLSVLAADKLLRGNFVQHIESQLVA